MFQRVRPRNIASLHACQLSCPHIAETAATVFGPRTRCTRPTRCELPFGARFGAKPPPPSRQDHPHPPGGLPLLLPVLPQTQNPHQRAPTPLRESQSPDRKSQSRSGSLRKAALPSAMEAFGGFFVDEKAARVENIFLEFLKR